MTFEIPGLLGCHYYFWEMGIFQAIVIITSRISHLSDCILSHQNHVPSIFANPSRTTLKQSGYDL